MRVLYFLIPIFVFSACRRDEPTRWTVDLAVPIAHGSLGLNDLVADSLLYADATGLWHLAFDYSLTGFDVDSLVEMPDTTIEKLFEVPLVGGPYDIPAGQEIINQDENTTLSVNNVELKEAIAKQGTLEYTVKSYVNGQLQCIYSLPGITLNGVPVLIDVHTMPGNQFIPFEFSGSINLSGYHFDLTGESGTASNQVFSNLIVKVDPLATAAAQVSGGDQIEITLKFVDPVVQYARGYFGQHLYAFNESIDVSGDMQFPSGVLNLEQAALSLEITNAVGTDAIVDFGTIRAINHENNSYVLLNHSGLLSPLNITRAFDNNGWIESTSVSELVNQSNSNLISFLEVLPDELAFNGKIEVNPLGNISDGNDFIYTDHALDARLQVDIPLCVGLGNISFTDTLSIEEDLELAANGTLVFFIENHFPFSTTLDVDMVNENGDVLHHVLQSIEIPAALPGTNPAQMESVPVTIEANISQALLDDFVTTHSLVFHATISTGPNAEIAKLYQGQSILFSVKAMGETEINVD